MEQDCTVKCYLTLNQYQKYFTVHSSFQLELKHEDKPHVHVEQ